MAAPPHRTPPRLPGQRTVTRLRQLRTPVALTFALLATLAGSGCVCRPAPAELVAARRDSPRHTVEAFSTYVQGGLYEQEYYCFSRDFRRRNGGLTLQIYGEVRDRLRREQPWLDWFAKVEVVGEESLGEGVHQVLARVAGRTMAVRLVREDFWRIVAADGRLVDGRGRFEEWVRVEPGRDGDSLLHARLPLGEADMDFSTLTSVSVERLWKIDDVRPLGDGPPTDPARRTTP